MICVAANLPAFESVKAAADLTRTMEGDSLKETWTCKACGMIHAGYKFRAPSGVTSGSGRKEAPQLTYLSAKKKYQVEVPV